nr:S1/P1 nuclease [uncultured Flavobacterium sp.]
MKTLKKSLAVICLLLITQFSFAWGTNGHRIIAEIAERHLTDEAKENIKKIYGNQKLAYWANWPDFIKSDNAFDYASSWHYVNIPGDLKYDDFLVAMQETSDDNMYKRALILVDELKNDKDLSDLEKQQKLAFLIHIIGDSHQPMHVGRAEDLGGNKITVEWFGRKTNIHSVWDSSLVDYEKYSYTEYCDVLDILSENENAKLSENNYIDWIFETYQLSNNIYSEVQVNDKLGYNYHYLNKQNIESQLLKGGLRLAKLLNEIYG